MGASQSALKSVAALKLALFWREAMSEAASEIFYLAFDRVFVVSYLYFSMGQLSMSFVQYRLKRLC